MMTNGCLGLNLVIKQEKSLYVSIDNSKEHLNTFGSRWLDFCCILRVLWHGVLDAKVTLFWQITFSSKLPFSFIFGTGLNAWILWLWIFVTASLFFLVQELLKSICAMVFRIEIKVQRRNLTTPIFANSRCLLNWYKEGKSGSNRKDWKTNGFWSYQKSWLNISDWVTITVAGVKLNILFSS